MVSVKEDNNVKNILIKSGKIVDPIKRTESVSDIYIKNGIISEIREKIDITGDNIVVINADGYTVSPGFVDMHAHLREPGFEDEETIESGTLAAIKGGITSVACMPNTSPAIDNQSAVRYILEKSKNMACNVFPVAAMTAGCKGINITEIGLLAEAGAIAFSDDGNSVKDSKLMYEIMRYSRQFGIPLILHEEDSSISKSGLVHEGHYSTILGLEGISSLSDDLMIARDIILAARSKARIHITHLSTKNSVKMIKRAKEEGVNITCDVTPHHLFFNDSCLTTFNTSFKVKPPIRSEEDRMALIEGIKGGVIDAIASDHAPHLDTEKNTTFKLASFGTIGLETLFSAAFTKLCIEEKISLPVLINLISASPAAILGIDAGKIEAGKVASITIIDTGAEEVIKKESFISKSKNSAFIGQKLKGKIVCTVSKGKLAYRDKCIKERSIS
ncbi:MAG: dihydroorotase [Candidatus Humimicrobiaceae bacterium]|jgi:dihydroorotase|nr:dihydroorotase [Actinomycetota bacterium]MDY0027444.1 dihydroorotase [Candidatus Humimicrobiaceae bacterium]